MTEALREYDDLQLRIDRDADGSYRVLAMAPDGRTARGSFERPITDEELDDFVQRVGLARRSRGSPESRIGAIRDFGSQLFEALVKDQVRSVYDAARAAASERGRGLRITLRLSGAPELMRLPWEFLYRRPRFIAQSALTPLVRSLDVDTARRPRRVRLPLRVLGMVSSPAGYPELDADAERRNLETALGRLRRDGFVELTWLERATLGELSRRISDADEIHVLHFIGHGAYDDSTEAGILVFETPQGRAHDVSGEDLGAMLQDEESLRLVVLNSCEGARTSRIDPFSGVATTLIAFDIPAVVGMQFEITDAAAIAFSESLYTGLSHGLPIDAAMAPARRAIVGALREAEFGTPVLYLRAGEARLFDIAEGPITAAAQPRTPSRPDDGRPEAGEGTGSVAPREERREATATAAPPSASRWRGTVSYLRASALRGVTTLTLHLDQLHEVEIVVGLLTSAVKVDGKRVPAALSSKDYFTLQDGDVERTCTVVTTQGSPGWGFAVARVGSCSVDGVPIPLEHGELRFGPGGAEGSN